MSEEESCVVRIVNLDETFTKETLKTLILTRCQPNGDIKNMFLKRNDKLNIFYAYIVFEHSYDAVKMVENLNDYVYTTNKFEVELIGPNLRYRKFSEDEYDDYWLNRLCRTCDGDHHSDNCPFKDAFAARENILRKRRERQNRLLIGRCIGTAGFHRNFRQEEGGSKAVPPDTKPKVDGASKAWRDGSSYANIYISNMHFSTTESDLAKLVEPFGPRKKVHLVKDKETGRNKGFGYVNFKFRSDATEAIAQLNGTSYKGRTLRVEWSKT